jgi:hypothetical protein
MHTLIIVFNTCFTYFMPISVATRAKGWVCGRSIAGIEGSNPAGGMDVCLLWVLCVVRQRSVRRADHSSGVVLPTVASRFVWSRNLKNEEDLTRFGRVCHRIKNIYYSFSLGSFSFMLPEVPQPYGLLYYPRIGPSNFLQKLRAATPPKQRKLEL